MKIISNKYRSSSLFRFRR